MNASISFSKIEDKIKDQTGCIENALPLPERSFKRFSQSPSLISDVILHCGKRDAYKEGGQWQV